MSLPPAQVSVSQLLYVPDDLDPFNDNEVIAAQAQCEMFDINKCGNGASEEDRTKPDKLRQGANETGSSVS